MNSSSLLTNSILNYDYCMELSTDLWSDDMKRIKPKLKRVLYKGNVDLLLDSSPKLAIVGSRRMSDYGKRVIERWMPELVQNGITIVSGFMYGVDQEAHKQCVNVGGKTIAVLGWGIDKKMVAEDEKLYQKILEVDSLIVSEYEGDLEGSRWTFPQRNRIVVGISDAVLVIEAAPKSGSLITARLANQFGKPLMCLPGPVTSKISEGTNGLIRTRKAEMVTSVGDILEVMGLKKGQLRIGFGSSMAADPVLEALSNGEMEIDELARVLKIPVPKLMEQILALELDGLIEERSGKYSII